MREFQARFRKVNLIRGETIGRNAEIGVLQIGDDALEIPLAVDRDVWPNPSRPSGAKDMEDRKSTV